MQTYAPTSPRKSAQPPRYYSTDEVASFLKVKPATVRLGFWRNGHYQGLKPLKSRNRFLLWPADEVDSLLSEGLA